MAAIINILNTYAKADSAKKVDIIIRNYPNFLGIVDGYTEGLRYMIENEKAESCFSKKVRKIVGCGSLKRYFYTKFKPKIRDFGAATWLENE